MLDIKSDGQGNWEEASVVDDASAGAEADAVDNPFAGIADAAGPGEIPAEFASAFSKYNEIEIDGIIYYFKEMSIEETILNGGNPLLTMAEDLRDDVRPDTELASDILGNADAMIHISRVVLNNLVEMRCGDAVLKSNPKLVWQLKKSVKLTLYNAILGLEAAEVVTVNRFPQASTNGKSGDG